MSSLSYISPPLVLAFSIVRPYNATQEANTVIHSARASVTQSVE